MSIRKLQFFLICTALLVALPAPKALSPLVLLISVDTLRADHLGCYGYSRDTSPFIDQLAHEATVYEQAFAHAPSTLPSHASLFTSLIPQHHQASHAQGQALPDAALTLAEIFLREGWRTASFNGGGQMAAEYGVDQGFEVYESVTRPEDRFSEIVESGLRWLDRHEGKPRFLFLHTFEVHQPPDPPPDFLALFAKEGEATRPPPRDLKKRQPRRFSEAERQWFVDRYDAEIRSMDAAFGELKAQLERRRLWDRALVIFTSDHGEEFGERGRLAAHAHTLFDELLRVPLIIKWPEGRDGVRRVGTTARLIDVAPTILSEMGLASPEDWQGLDLQTDSPTPRTLIALRDTATRNPVTAVRTADWKLTGRRLFDLRQDPRETENVASKHPEIVRRLELEREQIIASGQALEPEPTEPDEETKERLRALGYID